MIKNPKNEEENLIKDVKSLQIVKSKKQTIDTKIKDTANLFGLKNENKVIKDRILIDFRNAFRLDKENKTIKGITIRDMRNIFGNKKEEENYYKLVRVSIFCRNNYIEYERSSDRNKTLSVKKCFNKIISYLKDIINNLNKSDTQKIQATIAIIFISFIDNDEEKLMHPKSDKKEFNASKKDNKEVMINDEEDEVIK